MTVRHARYLIGCAAVLVVMLATGRLGSADDVDCDKPIAPCTACHSAETTREYAKCLITRWVAPESAKEVKSPLPDTPKVLAFGKATYEIYCEGCHGPAGDGQGHVALKFSVPVVSIAVPVVQAQTDGELFWKISNGRGAMPAWSTLLPEEDRWRLTLYIRKLAAPSADGAPAAR
jgi:hypothetical protein